MNKSSKINVNASSLVGLKAELFKKQEQLKRDRLQPGGSTSSNKNRHGESKKPSIWNKKNSGVQGRAEKDLEQLAEERDELDNARNKLEAKATFYEKMTKEGYIPDGDSEERFLVDFERKALDKKEAFKHRVEELEKEEDIPPPANPDEVWVDYTDTLGRSRRCMRKDLPNLISMDKKLNPQVYDEPEKKNVEKKDDLPDLMSNDMYREMLRKKWEEEEEEAAKGPLVSTHFQNVKYDEVRDMGVGYFDFSKDKNQRNQQMETLQLLRDETLGQRERREKLKLKRKAAMKARLEKIKERKRQKGEVIEDEEEEEEEEKKKEDDRLTEAAEETKPAKESKVREWDVGKEPVSAWEQKLTNIREERPAEFAPPSIYSESGRKRGQNQTPRYPPPKDYNSPFTNPTKEKTVNKPSSATSSKFAPPEFTPSEFAPPDSYKDPSLETRHRSKINLPPPRDYSSMYGRAKEKTGQKSSTATLSQWNNPCGWSDSNTPFTAGGGLGFTSSGGTAGRTGTVGVSTATMQAAASDDSKGVEDGESAIASALSFFRKNAGK